MSELALKLIASTDVDVLVKKGRDYGDSWKKRGGVGAFMMLARKWDRLENIAQRYGWDVFAAIEGEGENAETALDTLQDLRRYLLLVEEEIASRAASAH